MVLSLLIFNVIVNCQYIAHCFVIVKYLFACNVINNTTALNVENIGRINFAGHNKPVSTMLKKIAWRNFYRAKV